MSFMSIPSHVLETWSKQGAVSTPKELRERIEKVLLNNDSKIKYKNLIDIYLQGSYRNSTNIIGSSDVDIVVQSNATFFSDISKLNSYERDMYNNTFQDATYIWSEFKADVVETLKNSFGSSNVIVGNKSIKVFTEYYEADVIPCFEYRKYTSFSNFKNSEDYISGIKFFTTNENSTIINYPKKHYIFGSNKNKKVDYNYKPTIRIFKNIKKRLLNKNVITKELASSYFIENLLYNVPNNYFTLQNTSERVYNILKWLNNNKNYFPTFLCQNEQVYLFGSSQEQWNQADAENFISEVIRFWNRY